jgi:FKBP-type peptidyl-prolyl cis-trans isomerase (trigger factor)
MTKKTSPAEQTSKLQDFLSPDPKFEFTIAWEKVAPVQEKVLKNAAKQIKRPGFRPGKVPSSIAEDVLDKGYVIQEVLRELAPKAYTQALAKQNLKSFSEPEIVITKADKGEAWQLTAHLPQKPDVKLGAYQKFLKQAKVAASKQLASEQAAAEKQAKDQKNLDFKALTSEQQQNQITDRAIMALLADLKPKVSLILVKRTAQREWEKLRTELDKHHLALTDYLKNINLTPEKLEEQLMWSSLQNLQLEFILDALLEAEKITASEAEILTKIKTAMKDLTPEQLKAQLAEPSVKGYFELLTRREKLAAWLTKL